MISRLLLPVLLLLAAGASNAVAQDAPPLLLASADCSKAAAEAAAQTGGRVLTVSRRNQDGRAVCVVTLIVPGDGGARPRRMTVVVPQ